MPTPIDLLKEYDNESSVFSPPHYSTEGAMSPYAPTEGAKLPSPNCRVRFQEAIQEVADDSSSIPTVTFRSGRISKPPSKLSPDASKKTYSSICQIFELDNELLVDPVSYLADTVHPLSLAFKHHDEDNPSFNDALSRPLQEVFSCAMSSEVKELKDQTTWNVVPRPVNTKVLPGTWTFKVKRFPDGRFRKAKAQFCV